MNTINAGEWVAVEAVRQVRADWMVEVRLGGRWVLACECEREVPASTFGRAIAVGERMRVRA